MIYPHPYTTPVIETRVAHSAALELVNACRTLQDFDTLQIVHFPLLEPLLTLREVKGVKDLAVDSLKKRKVEFREGEGRKVVVKVIELCPHPPIVGHNLSSVKVNEFEV